MTSILEIYALRCILGTSDVAMGIEQRERIAVLNCSKLLFLDGASRLHLVLVFGTSAFGLRKNGSISPPLSCSCFDGPWDMS